MNKILNNNNNSDVLFGQLEKLEKKRVSTKARQVDMLISAAEDDLQASKTIYQRAKAKVKRMEKVLKKYKKTGDLSLLDQLK